MTDYKALEHEYGVPLTPIEKLRPARCVVLAVAHDDYVQPGWDLVTSLLAHGEGVVFDVRGCLPRDSQPDAVTLWRL